jgi:carboxypeptidase Q
MQRGSWGRRPALSVLLTLGVGLAQPVFAQTTPGSTSQAVQSAAGTPASMPATIPDSALAELADLQARALAGSGAFAIVESLTTEVGPRLVGSPGDAAAVAWAVARMKAIGLKNVRTEPVEGTGWVRGLERASIISPWPQPLQITALGGSVATPAGGLEGELLVLPDLPALEVIDPARVAGRIVLINELTPRAQDGAGYGLTAKGRGTGPALAAKKGAIAFLLRSAGTANHRFPHTGLTRFDKDGPRIPAAALSNADANLIDHMRARGKPIRLSLTLTPTLPGPVKTYNVIGEIPGSVAPSELVLLGAHLDSWDLGTGALDDGAGVGIVLASAELMLKQKSKPRRTIRFILFGAEEVGLVGAEAYLEAHRAELDQHIVGTEADFGAGPVIELVTRFGPDGMAAIPRLHQGLRPLGVALGGNTASGGPDMIPLRKAGMPVVTLQLSGMDYFDTHHTANDTLDRVDAKALDQSTAAYASFTWMAAQSSGRFGPRSPE